MTDKNSVWVKATIIILAVILALLGATVVLEAHQYYQKIPVSSYYEEANFNVIENLHPNPLYNQTSIGNPTIIYNSITNSVNITVEYDIQLNNMSGRNVTVISSVTLISSTPQWSKVIYTNVSNQEVSGKGFYQVPIKVNMSKDLALATTIDNQLQDGSSIPTLDFNTTVEVSGINSLSTSMEIDLHGALETVTYTNPTPITSTQFTEELIVPHNFIGINKVFGYGFIAGAGALVVYAAYLYVPRTTDPLERIKKEYGEQIVEIALPPLESAVKVKKLEDLLRISEILEVPVFLFLPDRVLFINHLGVQYYFEIT